MLRVHKMVTGIEVSVMFQSQSQAAGMAENAEGAGPVQPTGQSSIEI